MVSLDIEGAFDNAWWPALRNQLLVHKCPVNLYGMVMGYLRDREVVVRYAGGESRRMTSKGCIQGSIAGVRGRRGPDVFRTVSLSTGGGDQQGTSPCEGLGRSKVEVCTIETNAMVLTRKLKFDVPVIRMGNTEIALVDEIRLLGLTIDKGLTYPTQPRRAAASIYKGIARAAKATWG
ncbi:hypothetical protein EVAR_48135_1 [Eumeta japonica]|uniref:Uncharacterized protein n=1 Tax=Eumeta variegata TaxID=151549 RepID=A0A4C2A9H9_EUMVA|nr:hypothetical protein EVAR_48135_1 [Eumeta japonica]